MKKTLLAMTSLLVLTTSCKEQPEKQQDSEDMAHAASGYPIEPINIKNVKVHDDFWLPIIERVQEKPLNMP